FRMAEVTRATAQRQHQVIITERVFLKHDLSLRQVEIANRIEQHRYICPVRKDRADRLRDVWRGQSRRRHLIEQRLKQMVIGAVHQRDSGGWIVKMLAEFQSPKTCAQYYNVRFLLRHTPTVQGKPEKCNLRQTSTARTQKRTGIP